MRHPIRVAITGAAGQIGYSLLFRIAAGEMLGKDQPVILQLLDIPQLLPSLKGVVMELEDCAFPLLAGVTMTDDPKVAFRDVGIALLVGARPRSKDMERKDLLEANGAIFSAQGKALDEAPARAGHRARRVAGQLLLVRSPGARRRGARRRRGPRRGGLGERGVLVRAGNALGRAGALRVTYGTPGRTRASCASWAPCSEDANAGAAIGRAGVRVSPTVRVSQVRAGSLVEALEAASRPRCRGWAATRSSQRGQPPGAAAEQRHHRGHERHADDERVDEHAEGQRRSRST